ncbi:amidohydrolase family protein [Bradyrhizobium manausense]|uniref:amidohydrolase family protein n=1 Tax=Bradyrhizobium manausense TaxID=989370 RepID=UPI001BA7601F|nr:amidohydrolase family protein [Bradyrhizobium manausense]MBR0724197.1 amidohydrolase family protein [Bradyrhizobium manausense]
MIIDCAVHPVLSSERFNKFVGGPWNLRQLPTLFGEKYGAPFDQLAVPADEASSPAAVANCLRGAKIDYAVLSPTTFGYWPNPHQGVAVAQAANNMLAEDWLNAPEADGRFLGSIRVPMNDVDAALGEIERWADDPRFVQIVVPARGLATYGDQRFFPIWRTAAERGLAIFIHDDLSAVVEPPPTQVGFPSFYAEIHALRPLSGIVHLTSFIVSGVFERLPDLRVVLGDVSVHEARALAIRTDKDWQSDRIEVPWMTKEPTAYLERHVRFVSQPEDEISPHSLRSTGTLGGDNSSLVIFGSRHPYWDGVNADEVFPKWSGEERARCLGGNAVQFYPRLAALN